MSAGINAILSAVRAIKRTGLIKGPDTDEDDYTGFPKIIMYFAGDEVFAGIAPDYEKSFNRCGVKDYEIKIKDGMFHAWPVFTFLLEGREGEREIIGDINTFFCGR